MPEYSEAMPEALFDYADAFRRSVSGTVINDDAQLGADVESFLNSRVGRTMAIDAAKDIDGFIKWALSWDADPKEFLERRSKALAARDAMQWLAAAVNNGREAQRVIREEG